MDFILTEWPKHLCQDQMSKNIDYDHFSGEDLKALKCIHEEMLNIVGNNHIFCNALLFWKERKYLSMFSKLENNNKSSLKDTKRTSSERFKDKFSIFDVEEVLGTYLKSIKRHHYHSVICRTRHTDFPEKTFHLRKNGAPWAIVIGQLTYKIIRILGPVSQGGKIWLILTAQQV